jgi:PilZ domain
VARDQHPLCGETLSGPNMSNTRPASRAELNRPAWIDFGDGRPPLQVMAINISQTGAKLGLYPGLKLPPQFTVRFTANGDIAMVCEAVWSKDGAVGVRFVARAGKETPGKPAQSAQTGAGPPASQLTRNSADRRRSRA